MRTLIVLVLVVVVAGVGMKAAGYDLPLLDFPLGPFGEELRRQEIQIQAPGYDLPTP